MATQFQAPPIEAKPFLDYAIQELGKTQGVLGSYPAQAGISIQDYRDALEEGVKQSSPPLPDSILKVEVELPTQLNKKGVIPMVLYVEKDLAAKNTSIPVVLYFHGGAYIIGSPSTHEFSTAKLAYDAGCAVLSVHYSLSPEEVYPVANKEGYEVYQTLRSQKLPCEVKLSGESIAIMGDSAGGNMSSAVVLQCIQNKTPLPKSLVMLYPVVDYADESWSYRIWPEELGLHRQLMRISTSMYCPDYLRRLESWISPLKATDDDLKAFPETVIVISELDVLRGEAEAFGRRLMGLGVKTFMTMTYGVIHDYTLYAPLRDMAAYKGTIDMLVGHVRRTLMTPGV